MSGTWRAALALALMMPLAGQAQAAAQPARASPPIAAVPAAGARPAPAEPGRSPNVTGEAARPRSGKDPLLPGNPKEGQPGETGTSAPPWQSGGTTPGTEEPAEVGYKGRCGG